MKISIAQICSGEDPWTNLERLTQFVHEAENKKSDLVCFPENAFYRGPKRRFPPEAFFEFRDGLARESSPFIKEFNRVLATSKISVSIGSVAEKSGVQGRPYNSHLFIGPDRRILSYRKIHLFCFAGTGASYDESRNMSFGEVPQVADLPPFRIGLSICYDLRFPELFREYLMKFDANLMLVPAAFTFETGKSHWHTLLRARAIENLSFIAAAGQWGKSENDEGKKVGCYGHSIVYGPWGEILAEAPEEGDALIEAELSVEDLHRRREQLPIRASAKRSPFWRNSCGA